MLIKNHKGLFIQAHFFEYKKMPMKLTIGCFTGFLVFEGYGASFFMGMPKASSTCWIGTLETALGCGFTKWTNTSSTSFATCPQSQEWFTLGSSIATFGCVNRSKNTHFYRVWYFLSVRRRFFRHSVPACLKGIKYEGLTRLLRLFLKYTK